MRHEKRLWNFPIIHSENVNTLNILSAKPYNGLRDLKCVFSVTFSSCQMVEDDLQGKGPPTHAKVS